MADSLTINTSQIFIDQKEPLAWLVAIIFSPKLANRKELLSASLDTSGLGYSSNPTSDIVAIPAAFNTNMEIYAAAADFVQNNKEAKQCFDAAQEAVEAKKIRLYVLNADIWGEKPSHEPETKADTYDFLLWAEGNGYQIPEYVLDSAKYVIQRTISDRQEEEVNNHLFPAITPEQFEMVQKEPTWTIKNGILYLLGHRQRGDDINKSYKGGNDFLYRKIMSYAAAAHSSESLKVIDYTDGMFSRARVVPAHFIEWAKTLPIQLPMLKSVPVAARPVDLTHNTPEMELMFDAIAHFWSHYKPDNSNASAPLKKLVTSWLHEEATKRGVTLSKNLAEAIDTIIRPPKERGGGYKSTTP